MRILEQSNFGRTKLDLSRVDRYFRWMGDWMPQARLNRLQGFELVRHPDKLR
jgi:hypothetical protein